MKTLLGAETPPEEIKKRKLELYRNTKKWEASRLICKRTLEAFEADEITFETAVRFISNSFKDLHYHSQIESSEGPEFARTSDYKTFYIEILLERNLKKPQLTKTKKGKIIPKWIIRMSFDLVDAFNKDGFKKTTNKSKKTAYDKTCELLKDFGINLDPEYLENCYNKIPNRFL